MSFIEYKNTMIQLQQQLQRKFDTNKDFEKFYEIDTDPRDGQLTLDQFKQLVKDAYVKIPKKAVTEAFDYAAKADGDPDLSYNEYGMAMSLMNKMKREVEDCQENQVITPDGCLPICQPNQVYNKEEKKCKYCPDYERPRPDVKDANGYNHIKCGPDPCTANQKITVGGTCEDCKEGEEVKDKKLCVPKRTVAECTA